MTKEANYGSIEEKTALADDEATPSVEESSPSTIQKLGKLAIIVLVAAVGCSTALYAFSSNDTFSSADADTTVEPAMMSADDNVSNSANLTLPDYLEALDSSDPDYDASMLTSKYVIGEPGQGNMVPGKVELVRFVEEHFVFRTYGGGAKQCGWWWVLNPPRGKKETYFDHFAICPEWNDADNIVRCRVPENYVAVVGIGQTVTCPSGQYLDPDPSNLQLNGNICEASVVTDGHLSCEYCVSNDFNLRLSKCSNNGPDYIDGFVHRVLRGN